jgi:hypothetical protein
MPSSSSWAGTLLGCLRQLLRYVLRFFYQQEHYKSITTNALFLAGRQAGRQRQPPLALTDVHNTTAIERVPVAFLHDKTGRSGRFLPSS